MRAVGLSVGDRLPPERELAARLDVSRVSVKQALLILEVQGAITTRQGGGSYLLREGAAGAETVAALLADPGQLPQAFEARHALEAKLAQLAALRRTEGDLAALDAALAAMAEDDTLDPTGRAFHDALARAAHNDVLRAMVDQLPPRVTACGSARALAEHRALLAAIRAGDPVGAVTAVDRHLAAVAETELPDATAAPFPYTPARRAAP